MQRSAGDSAEVWLEISVAGLPVSHSAYEAAAEELLELAEEYEGIRVEEREAAAEGTKGGITGFFAKLLAPGGENAIVQLVRAWLGRDRRRAVTVSVEVPGGGVRRVEISGEHVSMEGLIEALRIAVPALGVGSGAALDGAGGAPEQGMISQ